MNENVKLIIFILKSVAEWKYLGAHTTDGPVAKRNFFFVTGGCRIAQSRRVKRLKKCKQENKTMEEHQVECGKNFVPS